MSTKTVTKTILILTDLKCNKVPFIWRTQEEKFLCRSDCPLIHSHLPFHPQQRTAVLEAEQFETASSYSCIEIINPTKWIQCVLLINRLIELEIFQGVRTLSALLRSLLYPTPSVRVIWGEQAPFFAI